MLLSGSQTFKIVTMGSLDPADLQQGYHVSNDWHSKPGYLRVIMAGAGASGLCMAYKMKEKFNFENYDLVCYEKYVSESVTCIMLTEQELWCRRYLV